MANIYTFVDYTGFLAEVRESDLNFAGDWRSTANYYRYDVVNYGSARYVCTVANTNTAPPATRQFSSSWSIIAFTSTGTATSGTNSGGSGGSGGGASTQMVQDVYSLAYRAYSIALTGTDLPAVGAVAPWVMSWIGQTYNLARAGTNAANSADKWGRDAYSLAVSGTNAADRAWSYAGQAHNIAVAGTDSANAAYSLARQALQTAWVGTSTPASGVPAWVMSWVGQSFNMAAAGTNAANQDWSYAGQAWTIAVAGTNAAAAAQATADAALAAASSASSGTTGRSLVLCAGYTPVTIGPDVVEVPVPYSPNDGVTAFTWQVRRASLRVQTPGGAPWVIIEKSNGTGAFSAISVGTISLTDGAYEGSVTSSLGTVVSGDKMRFNVGTLATALNWTVVTEIAK